MRCYQLSTQSENRDDDQANELRSLFNEVENADSNNTDASLANEDESSIRKIDILNLPPRKEIHTNNKRAKLKLSKPFLRLIFISLLVIAILIGALYLWDGELTSLLKSL